MAILQSACRFTFSLLFATSTTHAQQTLHVGPDQRFANIASAVSAAAPGDTIVVHPLHENMDYEATAISIRTPRLTIRSATLPHKRISLRGDGRAFSGVGADPRAIIQFDPGADGCIVEGFELSGAHNDSHNGAGIRINQANGITVRSCSIHDNDMGIMSNGDTVKHSASDQRIEFCDIHDNGTAADPGQNHNLYLGGHSAVVSGCEVHSSTTGHNIKSRAHYTRIEYCYIHDSANRECDIVDAAGDTDIPASDAVIIGCIISKKSPDMPGNRTVIHFGQDGGHDHVGTLSVLCSTIITPYVSPVISLSAAGAKAAIKNCLFTDDGSKQHNQVLIATNGKAVSAFLSVCVSAEANAHSAGFNEPYAGIPLTDRATFANASAGDFRLIEAPEHLRTSGIPFSKLAFPDPLEGNRQFRQYKHPQSTVPRTDAAGPCIGACE